MRKKAIPNLFDPSKDVSYRLDLLIQLLYDFDCHERFYVIRDLTGECGISAEYKDRITDFLKIPTSNVEFWSIDYSIDWLYAALFLSQTEPTGSIYDNVGNIIRGNNEDVDILLALRAEDKIHLVMIEVKIEIPFSESQLTSKVRRLEMLFGTDGKRFPHIYPHWLLASPYRSRRISTKDWPSWMTNADDEYLWYEIKKNFHSMKITRCDSKGTPCKHGAYWILEGRKGVKLSVNLTLQERQAILRNIYISDQVKLPLESLGSEQSTVDIYYSIPDFVSILHAVSQEAERTNDTSRAEFLSELHDRLSTLLYDEGAILP
ncbi:hypothetical protein ES706_02031 [subsurface metagenome]|nr:hypothetical protein [Dehalococcoidia bacterium]